MDAEELRERLHYILLATPIDACWTLSTRHLLQLVNEVVEAEREACAKVCDELAAKDKLSNYYAVAARAIRARNEKAKATWHCPLKKPDCKENCGSYGCGN